MWLLTTTFMVVLILMVLDNFKNDKRYADSDTDAKDDDDDWRKTLPCQLKHQRDADTDSDDENAADDDCMKTLSLLKHQTQADIDIYDDTDAADEENTFSAN